MKTVTCPNCGAPVDENIKKCPYCETIVNENGIDPDEVRRKEKELREKCIQLLKEGKIIRARNLVTDSKAAIYNIKPIRVDQSEVGEYLSKIKREESIPDTVSVGFWCYHLLGTYILWGPSIGLFVAAFVDDDMAFLYGAIPAFVLWIIWFKSSVNETKIK